MAAPILVTGSHRSGTTWVGAVLSLSGEAHLIHEPFNPRYYRSWLTAPPPHWFEHVAGHNAERYSPDVTRILALRPPFGAMLGRARSPRQLAMVGREQLSATRGRRLKRRALLKDPIAFFSAEWLAGEHGFQPLVLIRHPAAFASSLKRLDWQFDFRNLLHQSALMQEELRDFRGEVEAAVDEPLDVIGQATLLWRIFARVTMSYREAHPDWLVWRYEDLAARPLEGFRQLYTALSLSWSAGVASAVEGLSSPHNPAEPEQGDKGGVARNSEAAMWTWRTRLTPAEADRVHAATRQLADSFGYGSAGWPP